MSDERPTHLDLFSGIGGFSLAAEAVGFRTIGFSEVDAFASAVLRKHWPDVTNYGDVRTVPIVGCDLITGGFPCQPFSCAGKRGGASDDRFIWPTMLDVIRRCRPAWVLGENVPGIIGMELDRCLSDLEDIGFRSVTFVVPACAVDAHHRRDRVWILANRDGRSGGAELGKQQEERRSLVNGSGNTALANAKSERSIQTAERCEPSIAVSVMAGDRGALWPPEPAVGRVAHGIPNRSHRLKGLGNAIVPQVAEVFLRAIHQQLRP